MLDQVLNQAVEKSLTNSVSSPTPNQENLYSGRSLTLVLKCRNVNKRAELFLDFRSNKRDTYQGNRTFPLVKFAATLTFKLSQLPDIANLFAVVDLWSGTKQIRESSKAHSLDNKPLPPSFRLTRGPTRSNHFQLRNKSTSASVTWRNNPN